MKCVYFVCLFQFLTTTFLLSQVNPAPLINPSARVVSPISVSQADPKAQARVLDQYGKLPLSFEANHGQADGQVKFLSRTAGYTLFLTGDEALLVLRGSGAKRPAPKGASRSGGATVSLKRYPDTNPKPATPQSMTGDVLQMKLRHANAAATITGVDELAGTSNYFIGNDPAKWRANVPTYAKVKYEGIYSGIDLVYYGNQRQLEYDFIVAPGADPRRIAFDVRGAKRIRRDKHGDLVLKMGEGEIRWHKPVVYQEKDGARQLVAAHYAIMDTTRIGFELAEHDTSRSLYIDPLIYSTYLGGSDTDAGYGIAVDSAGNAYVTGETNSTDFPTTPGAFQIECNGGSGCALNRDAFVTKFNPAGSALVYSTYLGGSGYDASFGIAADSAGSAYVTGFTASPDFPVTPGAFQTTGYGGFVSKLSPTGSALVYSTYFLDFPGNGGPAGIAVDGSGNAYVTGSAGPGLPLMNPLQSTYGGGLYDAFVAALNPAGSALVYSTYLGGSGVDYGYGIAVDSSGNAYVTGATNSTDFPTTLGAFQPALSGAANAFVTKINTAGSALVYSSYLGGSGNDGGSGIAVDSAGNAYIAGSASSTNFPVTPGAFQTTLNGATNAFVTKINTAGSALVYSTYLGGSGSDAASGIAVNSAGNAYVTGKSLAGFPITPGATRTTCKDRCAFVAKLNPPGSTLVYSTYLGSSPRDYGSGIAVDGSGNAYVTGITASTYFPTMNAVQGTYGGGQEDAFVAKIEPTVVPTITLSSSLNPSTYGQAVTFIATLTSGLGAPPDGETVTFMKGTTVLGTGTLSGGSASFTTSTLKAGTNSITAVYGGDSNFGGNTSKVLKQVVNKATTTTTLTSSLNPSNFGQSVTFTGSVTPQFGGTVKGSVTFYDGTTALKTVALSGGVAKFTTSTLTSGSHSIMATYNGSTSFIGSSASLTQTVN